MKLSTSQKLIVKSYLETSAVGLNESDSATLLNTLVSPAYFVWKSVVTRADVQAAVGFDWTRVDNLSVGKSRIWDWMFNAIDSMQPWRGNYRVGVNATWIGTQADLDVRAAVISACQRPVTNFEKFFVTQVTDGPEQSGNRGLSTNADKLGVDSDGAFIEGTANEQFVSDIRGGL